MRIEIIPLIGITIEDVTIKLGMEKNQVIERLGNGFQGNNSLLICITIPS